MDRAHQALRKIVFPVTRGEAQVLRHATAERMHAFIEASGLEIEAQQPHDSQIHRTLGADRKRPHRGHHPLGTLPRLP